MNNFKLVGMRNSQVVTSSRTIAKVFEKEHRGVLRDLDNLKEGVAQNWADLFYETTYIHEQNKQEYREILMNRDGFTLLAMGFTGKKALEWKLEYIKAFNEMERKIQEPKALTPMETLKLQYEVLDNHDKRLEELEENMNLDYSQQLKIQKKAKQTVLKVLGGKDSNAYKNKSISGTVFSAIWRDYKDYIEVASYRDTPRVDLKRGLKFLENWNVDVRLLKKIEFINNQERMEEIKVEN